MTTAEESHIREMWRRNKYPDACKRIDLPEKDTEQQSAKRLMANTAIPATSTAE
jgi:hypothetical protein